MSAMVPFTIAVGLAGCGATPEPLAAAVAVPVVEVPGEPEGEVAAPSSIEEPAGALRFVRALCEAATTGDDERVRASVALPLSGQERRGEAKWRVPFGNPRARPNHAKIGGFTELWGGGRQAERSPNVLEPHGFRR